jgi:hypothetical protein
VKPLPPPRTTDELELADRDLEEFGVAVVRGVLAREENADVRRRLLAAADRSDAAGIPTRGYEFDPDSRNRRVFMLFNWDPVFLRLIEHPLAVRFVERALGETFLVSNFSANVTAPGSGEMTIHADQYYVPPPWGERMFAVNVAWLLDDFTDENGGTRVVPGSHRFGRPPAEGDPLETVAVEGPAGAIMVMDGRLWHRTGANRTRDRHRAALFGYYIQPWLRAQMNWNAVLDPAVAASLSPVTRERLGLDHGLTDVPRLLRRPPSRTTSTGRSPSFGSNGPTS